MLAIQAREAFSFVQPPPQDVRQQPAPVLCGTGGCQGCSRQGGKGAHKLCAFQPCACFQACAKLAARGNTLCCYP